MGKTQTKLTAYVCTDSEGYPETIRAKTPLAAARRYFKEGEYEPDDHDYQTYWVHIHVQTGDEESPGYWQEDFSFAVKPPVPPCEEGRESCRPTIHKRHRWGTESLHAKGGGVAYWSTCSLCGCRRERTNWAQDPHTGEQGLDAVNYHFKDDSDA